MKPFAQVVTTEDTDEECSPEICGEEEADDGTTPPPAQEPTPPAKITPPPAKVTPPPAKVTPPPALAETSPPTPTPPPPPAKVTPPPPPPAPAAQEPTAEELATKQKAQEAVAQKAAAEAELWRVSQQAAAAKLKAEQEAAQKAEAEAKLAQEAALKKAEAELLASQQEEKQKQQEITRVVQESPVFLEIVQSAPPAPPPPPPVTDFNNNGVPDNLEQSLGINPNKVDQELVKFEVSIAAVQRELVKGGKSQEEANKTIQQEIKKKKVEKKIETIRQVAQKKYNQKIENVSQDTNGDGVTDEVEVVLGLNPKEKAATTDVFSAAEKKLYGVDNKKGNDSQLEKRCTTSLTPGIKLASDGFSVLAACPRNKAYTLFAIDRNGKETALETKESSDNNKMIFAIDTAFEKGQYLFQVRPANLTSYFPALAAYASVLNNDGTNVVSAPVLVNVVPTVDVPQPVVQSIEGVEVAGLSNISVTAGEDGKVRVSGVSDISTMVIGTFQSAVFTSAILADVTGGAFEVVSPRALTAGNHEVVIYATRPEESTQSKPVKLRFSLIPVAQAASGEGTPANPNSGLMDISPERRNTAEEEKSSSPWPMIGLGAGAVLLVGAVVAFRKKKGAA